MDHIALSVLGIAGLFAIISLFPALARRLRLPFTVLLAALGIGLGWMIHGAAVTAGALDGTMAGSMASDFLASLSAFEIPGEAFLTIFLPTLLFEMALLIDLRRLMDDLAPVLLLAVVAVVVTTLAVGFGLAAVGAASLAACLLVGAIVATTDPAAVISIFREIGAPKRLTLLVEGESLLNDAAAIALFTLLFAMTMGEAAHGVWATIGYFLRDFLGGAVAGYAIGRLGMALLPILGRVRPAEVTFTVALAYLAFILPASYLHVSGVVAVAACGLTVGTLGRTRFSAASWNLLVHVWEQLGFWANSLIFVIAAMFVPRLLSDLQWQDALWLAILVATALAGRALVLFGLLPLLSLVGLAQKIEARIKTVIVWGGLRGAVSLALALAVTENPNTPEDLRHLVGVLVTGFVLVTLAINGPTLGPLVRMLGLDRLTPAERAMRDRAVALTVGEVGERLAEIGKAEGLDPTAIAEPRRQIGLQAAEAVSPGGDLDLEARTYIGLAVATRREELLCRQRLAQGTAARATIETLLAAVGRIGDGLKAGGAAGYETAAAAALDYDLRFRLAYWLHEKFGSERPLARALGERFAFLFVAAIHLRDLTNFARAKATALIGADALDAAIARLDHRRAATERALAALRLQYPDYARRLERSYLERMGRSLLGDAYRQMQEDGLLSQDSLTDLLQTLEQDVARGALSLDIALTPDDLVARVPLFADLAPAVRARIARLLKPRLVLPEQRIVKAGDPGDAMFFIVSGAVEVQLSPQPVRLGSGDFFGEIALLARRRRTASVLALGHGTLLVLSAGDLEKLSAAEPAVRAHLEKVAQQRLADQPGRPG